MPIIFHCVYCIHLCGQCQHQLQLVEGATPIQTPTCGGCYQSGCGSQPIVEGPNDPTEGGFHNFLFHFVHVQILV
jgi:hypothetical protein